MMTVDAIMIRNPVKVKVTSSIREAIKIMEQHGVASLIVVDENDRVWGVVTAKDILLRAVAKGLDLDKTSITSIMSYPVTVIERHRDIKEVVKLMIGTGHGHIPVVDDSGKVVGIVTVDDVLKIALDFIEMAEYRRAPIQSRGFGSE